MSQRNVEMLVGRLLTDEAFRRSFFREPEAAVRQLAAEGMHFTCVEMEALARINPALTTFFAEALDSRIQKADCANSPECDGRKS